IVATATAATTHADDHPGHNLYVSLGYSIVDQDDSNNQGEFSSAFTTGTVTGVNPPLNIPAGANVGWDTEFDRGDSYSIALGKRFNQWRVELAYSRGSSDIDEHNGVSAAGIALDAIDVGVLITGNVGDLGISTGDFVANAGGSIDTETWMINAYYDFDLGWPVTPFIGAGIGISDVDVDYSPSNTEIIDDDDRATVYQWAIGLSYPVTDNVKLQFSYSQLRSDDVEVDATLIPAKFEIENDSSHYNFSLRFSF
ncbi:MAG: porin, partial [Pseudomonadota bacterium]|nr:porin [Pseudomonadota bacterium]